MSAPVAVPPAEPEPESDVRKDHINKIVLSDEVQRAIEQVLQSSDPLDHPDFDPTDYVNQLFPNEQSLSNIDDVITKMEVDIGLIDDNIRSVVRGQVNTGENGRMALREAQQSITQLFGLITDIKSRAEQTEDMVKEITRDIKQLDSAKNNLTYAITTLNHLHMLVGGVENLKRLAERRQYGEVLNPLQAIIEVNQHFQQYSEIPQIQTLSSQVQQIQTELATQITEDFRHFFAPSAGGGQGRMTITQLKDACQVVSVLDKPVKRNILKWYINLQLQEYIQLFHENQDIAWLDKIDKRYAWVKRHLLDFEEKYGAIFPQDWEISERITVQFCAITREELTKIMARRRTEMDVKLLLFAIQKTANFEQLLDKRFQGSTLTEMKTSAGGGEGSEDQKQPTFIDLIGQCFKAYLDIYTDSIDRSLAELIGQFVQQTPQQLLPKDGASVFPNCAELFVFYKKCMVQCTQLSNEKPMYDLTLIFKRYLREYSSKVLEARIPKLQSSSSGGSSTASSISNSMSLLTKDFQNLSTAAGQVIHNFLKEGEAPRFSMDDIRKICFVLATAEYCLETVQQLEDKLKEKIDKSYANRVDLSDEKDVFHRIISNCIGLLVQDLDTGCEQSLNLMTKISWHNISNVGDQSGFVNQIVTNLKQSVPVIRDNLATSRKYYTQFCHKFVNSFIPKYINTLYRLRPTTSTVGSSSMTTSASSSSISDGAVTNSANASANPGGNILGCEQLLLDTHSLKTVLMDLPSIGSQVQRKPPASYTKVVVKGMAKAEMIIKVVMQPIYPATLYIEQYLKLLPESHVTEFHKILEMKSVRKIEQQQLVELYKRACPQQQQQQGAGAGQHDGGGGGGDAAPLSQSQQAAASAAAAISGAGSSIIALGDSLMDKGRIKKIESLIKNRLPN
ncbi:vacuolar protein sorting-associated protein 53 homolog [Culex pipiens pallens]|uniref:vacuolar protein sorting-associated protein 53 homolog n=1 Tax=Culex pipiens pallens TaxID=42434 RepID=UPI001954BECB|nr:vacuolar protein sorting-associated protein 53 homolog [Culex pipiens pallens]